ncbi:hypothetical protein T02_13726 [Trichinella nativa]|uniref:Uncharacterized protein n=1 Tax=Trichinella nativa TaxID=6335 RepID=A0A0V1KQG2_9BILA|nr:hypothetical protein T02_13726 [Trichinella nativa]
MRLFEKVFVIIKELNIACAKERCPLNGHSAADSALDEGQRGWYSLSPAPQAI